VLPVLGAVPDGMMVLFSGLGTPETVSKQIGVGVGTMAGSTVMLLTMSWFLAIYGGRVNITKSGRCTYHPPDNAPEGWEKLHPADNVSLTRTGVKVKSSIRENAYYMLLTAAGFVIVQLGSYVNMVYPGAQTMFYWLGLAWGLGGFGVYLKAMYDAADDDDVQQQRIVEAIHAGIDNNMLTLRGALGEVRSLDRRYSRSFTSPLIEERVKEQERLYSKLGSVLKPYFKKYDTNGDGVVDFEEFRVICSEVSQTASRDAQLAIFNRMDTDKNGTLEFEEFVDCMLTLTRKTEEFELLQKTKSEEGGKPAVKDLGTFLLEGGQTDDAEVVVEDDEEDEDEEEDLPEDLAAMSPDEQQKRIKMRAAWKLCIGSILIIIFSDPMVDVLQEMSDRIGVPSFYVAFVLAPLVSNAAELIATYNYAKKKTMKTITISMSTLEGAACMNNTYCFSMFMVVILMNSLSWSFFAEVTSMVLVEIILAVYAYRVEVMTLGDGLMILGLYPGCLAFVWICENIFGLS